MELRKGNWAWPLASMCTSTDQHVHTCALVYANIPTGLEKDTLCVVNITLATQFLPLDWNTLLWMARLRRPGTNKTMKSKSSTSQSRLLHEWRTAAGAAVACQLLQEHHWYAEKMRASQRHTYPWVTHDPVTPNPHPLINCYRLIASPVLTWIISALRSAITLFVCFQEEPHNNLPPCPIFSKENDAISRLRSCHRARTSEQHCHSSLCVVLFDAPAG